MSKGTILVIDDEKDLVELVRSNLERDGFDVAAAHDGSTSLQQAKRTLPNLILLDIMMPGMDGLDVCREIRADSRTRSIPVIMLTARAEETDKVVGLELGADDYMTKPFSPRELVARVKAQLRRNSPQQTDSELRVGRLIIDPTRHRTSYGGSEVSLTAGEFRILHYLAQKAGAVRSRGDIIASVLGPNAVVTDRTIDVHVTALRRKLGAGGDQIETVRGFGYRLKEESPE